MRNFKTRYSGYDSSPPLLRTWKLLNSDSERVVSPQGFWYKPLLEQTGAAFSVSHLS